MLIKLDRREHPGLLLHGVSHGIHWRAVRDVSTLFVARSHHVYSVYLQCFVDAAACGMTEFVSINGVPALYNNAVLRRWGSITVAVVSEYACDVPARGRMRWVETYYGKLRMSARVDRPAGAEMFAAWYPRYSESPHVDVLTRTFNKYITPAAQYLCNYLTLVADDTAATVRDN